MNPDFTPKNQNLETSEPGDGQEPIPQNQSFEQSQVTSEAPTTLASVDSTTAAASATDSYNRQQPQQQETPGVDTPATATFQSPPAPTSPYAEHSVGSSPEAQTPISQTPNVMFGSALGAQHPVPVNQPVSGGAKRKFNKKIVIIGVSAAAAILLSSAAMAYAIIKNTPEMILRDAFYATSAKTEGKFDATVDIAADDQTGKIFIAGAWKDKALEAKMTLQSDVLPNKTLTSHVFAKDQKTYVKIDDIRKNLESIAPEMKESVAPFDPLINRVDGKWVVITEEDLEKYFGVESKEDKRSVCVEQVLDKYQSDKKQQQEVFDAYSKNKFLTVTKLDDEDVNGRSAHHFSVVFIEDKADGFGKAIEQTTVYKAVKACVPETDSAAEEFERTDANENEPVPDMQIWVDKQTRTLRKIQVKNAEESKASTKVVAAVVFDYFTPVQISEPKAAVTIDDLMSEIEKLQSSQSAVQGINTVQSVLGTSDRR